MTKTRVKCFSIFLCVLLVCISFTACLQEKVTIKDDFVFKLEDYKRFIDRSDEEINVGKIKDADDAVSKAIKIFIETYGEESTNKNEPYHAHYDAENDAWLVIGTLELKKKNPNATVKGGTPTIIFDSEGNVLTLFRGK